MITLGHAAKLANKIKNIHYLEMQKQRFPQKGQILRESDRIEDLEIERVIKLWAPGDGYKNVLDIGTKY
jgi:hypothetical protein